MIIFPTYNSIFNDDVDNIIQSLSASHPSVFIKIVSSISSQLYFTQDKYVETNSEILYKHFGRALMAADGQKILKWISQHSQTSVLISNYTITELYKILLNNDNDNYPELGKDTTAEDELLLLKLILIANQNRSDFNHYEDQLKKEVDDKFLFQKFHWPIMLSQVDCNNNINFTFEMCKLVTLTRQLEQQSDSSKDVIQSFFKERGFDSVESYAVSFFLLIMKYYLDALNRNFLFCIQANEQLSNLLDPLCINGKVDVEYLTIKSYPIYKNEENYFVLNWNYFSNQIYTGTYIALRNVLEEKGINTNLKSDIGSLLEENLMRPIIKTAFSSYAQKMKFDCEYIGNKGYPDAYIQIGHRIYLFEFKDSLLSEKVMESCSFESIKEHLEQTFVCSKRQKHGKEKIKDKAVCQLINYIENIVEEKYNSNELNLGYKKSYVIYPIILYTDYRYEISGFNDYLAKRFEEVIGNNPQLSNLLNRHKIMPLTFIGLEFFFNNMDAFQTKKINLHQLIEKYHKKINRQVREHEKTHIQDRFSQLYYPFERIHYDYFYIIPPKEKEFPLVMKCFKMPFSDTED